MKNWNCGQYIAASTGAALLASFATLATPKTASAATLSFDESINQWVSDNEAEAVSQIMNLDIGGKKYNVTFEPLDQYSYGSLKTEQQQGIGTFGYTNSTFPEPASFQEYVLGDSLPSFKSAEAIMNALGDSFWIGVDDLGQTSDSFSVLSRVAIWSEILNERFRVWGFSDDGRLASDSLAQWIGSDNESWVYDNGGFRPSRPASEVFPSFSRIVAVFEEAEVGGGGGSGASTPEPSLIFGLITLGGLMLGSNARKNKD